MDNAAAEDEPKQSEGQRLGRGRHGGLEIAIDATRDPLVVMRRHGGDTGDRPFAFQRRLRLAQVRETCDVVLELVAAFAHEFVRVGM